MLRVPQEALERPLVGDKSRLHSSTCAAECRPPDRANLKVDNEDSGCKPKPLPFRYCPATQYQGDDYRDGLPEYRCIGSSIRQRLSSRHEPQQRNTDAAYNPVLGRKIR
jgi:hypothetical protein